jgi:hypothetical protein
MLPVRLLIAPCRYREFFAAEVAPAPSAPGSAGIFFAKKRNQEWLWEVSPVRDHRVIVQRVCRFAVGRLKCDAELVVFETTDSRNEILFSENRRNLWQSDRELDKGFGSFSSRFVRARNEDV